MEKHKTLNIGRASVGAVDLFTGAFEYAHNNAPISPIMVSHTYSSERGGFKLNLEQTLTHRDGNEAKWKYIDGNDTEHRFKERYYYRGVNNEKIFYAESLNLKPQDIEIKPNGKLYYGSQEVFTEIKTKSGFTLQTDLKNYNGRAKIETRREELVQIESEIESLERNLNELKFTASDIALPILNEADLLNLNVANMNIADKQKYYLALKNKYEKIIEKQNITIDWINANYNISQQFVYTYTDNDGKTLEALSAKMLERNIDSIIDNKDYATKAADAAAKGAAAAGDAKSAADAAKTAAEANNEVVKKNYSAPSYPFDSIEFKLLNAASTSYTAAQSNVTAAESALIAANANSVTANAAKINAVNAEANKKDIYDQFVIQKRFNERLEKLKQKMDEITSSFAENRALDDIVKINDLLNEKRRIQQQLVAQLPINYVIDENGIIFGFNKIGNLVAVFDNSGNQIAIIYEDDKIIRVVDSKSNEIKFEYSGNKLVSIIDCQDNKTVFNYEADKISKIIYPDFAETIFTWQGDLISKIVAPNMLGVQISYNNKKVVAISQVSKLGNIKALLSFVYNNNETVVANTKTGETETHSFDADGEIADAKIQKVFDDYGRIVKINMIDEGRVEYKYDHDDHLTKETIFNVDNSVDAWREFDYNKSGRQFRVKTDKGLIYETVYGEKGNATKTMTYHKLSPATKFVNEPENVESNVIFGTDFRNGNLLEMSCFTPEINRTIYEYENDYLKTIKSGDTEIAYTYDEWGRRTSVKLCEIEYVKYDYSIDGENDITTAEYANGDIFKAVADKFGKVLSVHRKNAKYDFWAKVFDSANETEANTETPDSALLNITFDGLGRAVACETPISKETYGYLQNGESTTTTVNSLVQTVGEKTQRTRYKYDTHGNVTELRDGFNNQISVFEYDELNRMVRDGNNEFEYDNNGNILFKKSPDKIIEYKYAGDKMISFGGKSFEYDILGNPTTYKDISLVWDFRSLVKFANTEFQYLQNGLRKSKTRSDIKTEYTWTGDRLTHETRTQSMCDIDLGDELPPGGFQICVDKTNIEYLYSNNAAIGFKLTKNQNEPQTYYYLKNLFGDITAIYSADKTLVAEYKYDAWGNCEIVSSVGGIAELNSIRYRGYYFDTETNLYYLRTRYYDPETARFLNMDDISIVDMMAQIPNGLNLYAYCGDNPITRIDSNGQVWYNPLSWGVTKSIAKGFSNAVSWTNNNIFQPTFNFLSNPITQAVLGFTTIVGLGIASIFCPVVLPAFVGSLIGGGIGLAAGIATGFATGDWKSVSSGFMWGAIGGALSGGLTSAFSGTATQVVAQSLLSNGIYTAQTFMNGKLPTIWGYVWSTIGGISGGLGYNSGFAAPTFVTIGVNIEILLAEIFKKLYPNRNFYPWLKI